MRLVTFTADSPERLHGFRIGLTAYPQPYVHIVHYTDSVVIALITDSIEEATITHEEEKLGPDGWE